MNLPLNLWDCDRFSLDDAAGVGVVVAEPKNQSIHQVYAVLKREVHARSLSHFCYHFQSRCHYSTLLVSSVLTFAKLLVENVSVITIADAGGWYFAPFLYSLSLYRSAVEVVSKNGWLKPLRDYKINLWFFFLAFAVIWCCLASLHRTFTLLYVYRNYKLASQLIQIWNGKQREMFEPYSK